MISTKYEPAGRTPENGPYVLDQITVPLESSMWAIAEPVTLIETVHADAMLNCVDCVAIDETEAFSSAPNTGVKLVSSSRVASNSAEDAPLAKLVEPYAKAE